jgi:hemerythrin superfamily protein
MEKARSEGASDAIEMLSRDHKRVQKLFKAFGKADRNDIEGLQEIVETACMELQIHAMLEEEIFYPAVRARLQDEKHQAMLNEAEVEHELAEDIIEKLQDLEPDDEMYAAYFNVLAECVRRHVKEEEKKIFPEVKKVGVDLAQIASKMMTRREELFAEIEDAGESEETPDMEPAVLDEGPLSAESDDPGEGEDEDERWSPERRH